MAEGTNKTDLEKKYPLHWCIWDNNIRKLRSFLESKEHDLELCDPRGRSPLHLAISLGHLECAQTLLRFNANANAENSKYWTAVHEATSTGDPDIVETVLQYRDFQRFLHRADGIPSLLAKLREAPDFYVEMTWEMTSWVPFLSRVCPSDTYKVYKSGSMVRIDTTLLGFDNTKWERGSRSYVFKGEADSAILLEVDHDAQVVYSENIEGLVTPPSADHLVPSADQVSARLTSPVVTSYVNTENIEFERAKQGLWGFRTDKTEVVNGYTCKVFNASNVQFITQTRTEHLCPQDKKDLKKNKSSLTPLENFLGLAKRHTEKPMQFGEEVTDIHNPCCITPEEYFDATADLGKRDIGRPREVSTKIQSFKASLSLCEDYPLTLQEQVLPIIDLMAATNAHFRKLRDFITLQLPSGFPVKVEIPLYHIVNAKVTFGNIFSCDKPVDLVTPLSVTVETPVPASSDNTNEEGLSPDDELREVEKVTSCAVDPSVFESPPGYRVIGQTQARRARYADQDDQLLQYAIERSLLEEGAGSELTLTEALETFDPAAPERANNTSNGHQRAAAMDYAAQLELAIELSRKLNCQDSEPPRQPSAEDDLARRDREELERVLALSIVEK